MLAIDPYNAYANYYLDRNDVDSTRIFYNRIVNAPNSSKNWYTTEAGNWLRQATGNN